METNEQKTKPKIKNHQKQNLQSFFPRDPQCPPRTTHCTSLLFSHMHLGHLSYCHPNHPRATVKGLFPITNPGAIFPSSWWLSLSFHVSGHSPVLLLTEVPWVALLTLRPSALAGHPHPRARLLFIALLTLYPVLGHVFPAHNQLQPGMSPQLQSTVWTSLQSFDLNIQLHLEAPQKPHISKFKVISWSG